MIDSKDPTQEEEARTSRIVLRRLRLEDAPDVHLIRASPEAMVYTPTGPATYVSHTEDWIYDCLTRPDCYNFSIELLPTDGQEETKHRVIGVLGATHAPEIGYMLHPAFWGKGLATEAVRAFMPLFWKKFEGIHDYASAEVDPEHAASRNILMKCGFTLWDTLEKNFRCPTLGLRDTEIYRLPRSGTTLCAKGCEMPRPNQAVVSAL